MKKKNTLILSIIIIFLLLLSSAELVMAQIVTSECTETGNCTLDHFINVFDRFYSLILQWLSVVALLFFIIGGVMLLISAGNQEKIKKGRQILGSAFAGIVVILASYLMVQFLISTITGRPPVDLGGSCAGKADEADCGDNRVCLTGNCVTECYYKSQKGSLPSGASCRPLSGCSANIQYYNDCNDANNCWKNNCPIGTDNVCCL